LFLDFFKIVSGNKRPNKNNFFSFSKIFVKQKFLFVLLYFLAIQNLF